MKFFINSTNNTIQFEEFSNLQTAAFKFFDLSVGLIQNVKQDNIQRNKEYDDIVQVDVDKNGMAKITPTFTQIFQLRGMTDTEISCISKYDSQGYDVYVLSISNPSSDPEAEKKYLETISLTTQN